MFTTSILENSTQVSDFIAFYKKERIYNGARVLEKQENTQSFALGS